MWLYLLPALLVFPCLLFAQFEVLPATEQQYLIEMPFDTMRVDTLNEWAFQSAGAAARQYAQLALNYARQINYREGVGDSQVQLGIVASDAGDYGQAEQLYRAALQERLTLKLTGKAAGCLNQLGHLKRRQGQYEAAIKLYEQGLTWMKDQPPHINTAKLYNSLGTACRLAGKYELAGKAFQAGAGVYEELIARAKDDKTRREYAAGLASLRLNRGAFFQDNLSRDREAKILLLASLADFRKLHDTVNTGKALLLLGNNAYYAGNLEEAGNYYAQGLALKNNIQPDDYFILLKNRGRIYLDKGLYDKALSDFQTSLDSFISLDNVTEIAATRLEIGNYHYERSELEKSVEYYRQALDANLNDPVLRSQLLFYLPDALDQLGRVKEADTYRDSFFTFMERLDSASMRLAKYRLLANRVGRQAAVTSIERQKRQAEKTRDSMLLGALGIICAAALLGFYINRQRRRLAERNVEIARQQEEIARQNEQIALREKLELLKNKELETNYARLAGQDEMQRRIGQELHDSVGAMLTSVKLNLSPVDEMLPQLPEDKRRQYAAANRLLGEATEEVRRISHELSSAILQKFGLKAQLEALAEIIPTSGRLQVELATHGLKERLDYHTELNIYRIVQELVHNVIKHAHAQNITIQVNRFDDRINVIVEDDGRGFDPEKVRLKPGLGMQNLAARVHDLGGELQIDSRPGRGATVSVDIPLKS